MSSCRLVARGSVEVERGPDRAHPRDLAERAAIDAAWEVQRRTNPGLHDSGILSVDAWEPVPGGCVVQSSLRPYRSYLAQRRGLFDLGIRPLGVTGATRLSDGRWLVGRRADRVTDHPGCWELVPSGSLSVGLPGERVDPVRQLTLELEEETGIALAAPAVARHIGLLYDDVGIFDIAVRLEVELPADWRPRATEEYPVVRVLDVDQLRDLMATAPVVPTFATLVDLLDA